VGTGKQRRLCIYALRSLNLYLNLNLSPLPYLRGGRVGGGLGTELACGVEV
jgi:hypothetical protein